MKSSRQTPDALIPYSADRRLFLKTAMAGTALAAGAMLGLPGMANAEKVRIELPGLPYAKDALDPYITEQTIGYHYDKHHKGYIEKTKKAIKNTPYEGQSLESIIKGSADNPDQKNIFDNAAQAWNHNFYWKSLTPKSKPPEGKFAQKIRDDFKGFDNLKKELIETAGGQFGSGWGWLVLDGDKLAVMSTSNADNPLVHGIVPLLTVDVWEHAYYLDYQNERKRYIQALLNKIADWEFAAKNLEAAMK